MNTFKIFIYASMNFFFSLFFPDEADNPFSKYSSELTRGKVPSFSRKTEWCSLVVNLGNQDKVPHAFLGLPILSNMNFYFPWREKSLYMYGWVNASRMGYFRDGLNILRLLNFEENCLCANNLTDFLSLAVFALSFSPRFREKSCKNLWIYGESWKDKFFFPCE